MYIYEGHLGSLYVTSSELEYEDLYCGQCGDSDSYIGCAGTKKEAWRLLKPITDINGSGGWDYKFVKKFIDENFLQ